MPTLPEAILDGKPLLLTPAQLEALLLSAETLAEHDPVINQPIRVLRYQDRILVQETSFKGEILLRRFASREAADAFVAARLAVYEKMWDGCGCKVDFDA